MTGRKGPMYYGTEVERLAKIVKLLRANPQGLSSKVIADRTGYSIATMRKDLQNQSSLFVTMGRGHNAVHKLTKGAQ